MRLQINHYCEQWIADWCQDHGWTYYFRESTAYWAFPPQAVMPCPLPDRALKSIKADKGLSLSEKQWFSIALISLVSGTTLSFAINQPLPLILGFAFCAIVVGQMDDE